MTIICFMTIYMPDIALFLKNEILEVTQDVNLTAGCWNKKIGNYFNDFLWKEEVDLFPL